MQVEALRFFYTENLIGFIIFQIVVLAVLFSNSLVMTRLRRHRLKSSPPLVSILVPARNEAANILRCVRSMLGQRYARFEVIVLDDRSDDGTAELLSSERDVRLTVLRGRSLPQGWTGKNWACHQLSGAAKGDILFFADADTVFEPDAVEKVAAVMLGENADFVSGFPSQVLVTFGEKLLVPIFYWAFISFTPLAANLSVRRSRVTRAIGQMMVFKRSAYEAVDGHASIKGSVIDDLDLAKRMRRLGLTCRMMDATDIISCRMYRNGREAYEGFNKNLFPAFGYKILPYFFVWLFVGYAYIAPLIWLGMHLALPGGLPLPVWLLYATIALSMLQWVFSYTRLRLPVWLAVFYPLVISAYEVLAVGSFVNNLRRKTCWKGRQITRPPIRWF